MYFFLLQRSLVISGELNVKAIVLVEGSYRKLKGEGSWMVTKYGLV